MMQRKKSISTEGAALTQHANADNLSKLVLSVYDVFNKTQEMFTEFCKNEKLDFSAKIQQVTANEQLNETNALANDYIKQIFGEKHGFKLPKAAVWKNEQVSIAEVLEAVKEQISDYIAQGAEKLGCKVVQKKVQLTHIKKGTDQILVSDSSHVDCLIYALYRLHETQAEECIFHKKPIFREKSTAHKLEVFIDQYGFRLVDNAKKGDFIVYINKEGILCHGGVMVDPNTVQSKWGTTDEIIEHPTECVPELYRYGYILLRKDGTILDTPWTR